ncbi:DUF6193 family natural product biosynthesis protein [Streptomyces sp. NPDC000229]|uniref:DUF6193 family natural product biosynthesis protein n=1 Tax=Streptomyces sp. NPDC000229 TaxID=3154247 RepID=UPI0033246F77
MVPPQPDEPRGRTSDAVDQALYPDVAAAGGLVPALRRVASDKGFDLGNLSQGEGPGGAARAKAVTERGTFLVAADSPSSRLFHITVWAPGADLGTGRTADLLAVAGAVQAWNQDMPLGEMRAVWPFIEFEPLAEAHVEGHAVATAWRLMRERHPEVDLVDDELTEAAYAEPRLRQLFPVAGHGWLHFSRTTRKPFSNDLAMIGPLENGWRVYGKDGSTLGDVATAAQAAALVVAHLPHDCGPAAEGQVQRQ